MSNITSMSVEELKEIVIDLGQPFFRAKQIYEWLHDKNVRSYDEMTNLPKDMREQLAERFPLDRTNIIDKQVSKDGTRKYLLELSDGNVVEMVGIVDNRDDGEDPEDVGRLTACVSSQVGCAMGCVFCATGRQGMTRNLTSDEIIDQILQISNDFQSRVSNVVIMGQGEPFQNYNAVLDAMRRMNTDKGIGIGARRITLSTCGVIDGVKRFSDEPEQFRLAVSLHSADQSKRNMLMPRTTNQPLSALKQALLEYNEKRGRRITFEYMLLEDINDSDTDLRKLISFCEGLNAHVNLLRFNPIDDFEVGSPQQSVFNNWIYHLSKNGISASTRESRGADIAGACGQLANKRS